MRAIRAASAARTASTSGMNQGARRRRRHRRAPAPARRAALGRRPELHADHRPHPDAAAAAGRHPRPARGGLVLTSGAGPAPVLSLKDHRPGRADDDLGTADLPVPSDGWKRVAGMSAWNAMSHDGKDTILRGRATGGRAVLRPGRPRRGMGGAHRAPGTGRCATSSVTSSTRPRRTSWRSTPRAATAEVGPRLRSAGDGGAVRRAGAGAPRRCRGPSCWSGCAPTSTR